jgi:hypothetical protein
VARWCPFHYLVLSGLVIVIRYNKDIGFLYLHSGRMYDNLILGIHTMSIWFGLKIGCDKSGTRVVLTVGCKPRVDWMPLRTYSLQNYFFQNFSFILAFIPLVLFKRLSYPLLFPNFRWLVIAAQPGRALDVSPLDS